MWASVKREVYFTVITVTDVFLILYSRDPSYSFSLSHTIASNNNLKYVKCHCDYICMNSCEFIKMLLLIILCE